MSDPLSVAARRLSQTKDLVTGKTATTIPFDPDCTSFPSRTELPRIPGAPRDAGWVWGKDDQIGRLNLLTPTRVKAAAAEIRTGEMARLDLPTNIPEQPAFGRESFKHEIKVMTPNISYDDVYQMNTQSGTQWDGFRHCAHFATRTFYNGVKGSDIKGPAANLRGSIHYWSQHGISGRAVFLDYLAYADSKGLRYDSATSHAISYSELVDCGKHQGIDIRPAAHGGHIQIGDILLIRSGFVRDYYGRSRDENMKIGLRAEKEQKWAGVKQEEAMLDWLHDCYFAAVGGDAPAFERWPSPEKYYLHEYILALWGMPLGEMLDLEKVSEICKRNKRWTFFFTSAPANCPGGVGSHVNGTAIF